MFSLLHSIFGDTRKRGGRYPAHLIKAAIERAVEGTDPRLRLLPGYARKLRAPMIAAIDHVVALVDALPAPLPASPEALAGDPRLAAVFYTPDRMRESLGQSRALADYLPTASRVRPIQVLLLADCKRKRGFGSAMAGELLATEVPITTITFENHRLLDPADSEQQLHRHLRRRAFDYLLTLALRRIIERRTRRTELADQKRLLRCKLDIMQRGGGGFAAEAAREERDAMQARLDAIALELDTLGPDETVLKTNLALLCEVLAQAPEQLWLSPVELRLNHLNIEDPSAPPAHLVELRDALGGATTLLPLSLDPETWARAR